MTEFEKYLILEIEQVKKDQKLKDTEYRKGKKHAFYNALNAFKKLSIHGVVVPKGTLCDCINKSFLEDLCDDCDSQINERWQP